VNFALNEEQKMIVQTTRAFVEKELVPHEDEVERLDEVRPELRQALIRKARTLGLYAANMPEEIGGGGLDAVTLTLLERELGRTSYALGACAARPSNILRACRDEQIERYLLPTVRGERTDCLAMTEPNAGSDLRAMEMRAEQRSGDFFLTGTKHFISHADVADYVIVFAVTGVETTARGPRKQITSFLVDKGTPGFTVKRGYQVVSHRGYRNSILEFDECRVPAGNVLGELHHGFDVANEWLSSTRLSVAATCVGRAQRALELCQPWAATRKQFGQTIGKFQGVSFKLADMAVQIQAAELLTLHAAWKLDQGTARDEDFAAAKLFASEMLGVVTDHAVQIFGGMGLAEETVIARFWRDARVERIWDGTSEIQRHIISRAMLRSHEQQ
jgi:acyl-CoA dehydrogenase